MLVRIKTLIKAEDGAVTVDWVVLTAAICLLGLAVLMPIAFNVDNATDSVAARISEVSSPFDFE